MRVGSLLLAPQKLTAGIFCDTESNNDRALGKLPGGPRMAPRTAPGKAPGGSLLAHPNRSILKRVGVRTGRVGPGRKYLLTLRFAANTKTIECVAKLNIWKDLENFGILWISLETFGIRWKTLETNAFQSLF